LEALKKLQEEKAEKTETEYMKIKADLVRLNKERDIMMNDKQRF
jgi:hypothetical protein